MTENKSKSIQVIELVRSLFEYIHGNLGLLKFSIDRLEPKNNGHPGQDSNIWEVECSFYEALGSKAPTHFIAEVNLSQNQVMIKKLTNEGEVDLKEPVKKFVLAPDDPLPEESKEEQG